MRAIVQRVSHASVVVNGETVGAIQKGFMVLVGVMEGDTDDDIRYMAKKISSLRVFEDADEKMNLSLKDVGGAVLLVSQFTLAGDVRHGNRPAFIAAARPEIAEPMFTKLAQTIRAGGLTVETGRFRTHMEVTLLNDGPVTIMIDSRKEF